MEDVKQMVQQMFAKCKNLTIPKQASMYVCVCGCVCVCVCVVHSYVHACVHVYICVFSHMVSI